MDRKAVVVTTEFRGVFFGYVENDSELPTKVELVDARNCVYWSAQTKGVVGLAATGPNKECKIGPKVPHMTLWKITGVFQCTPEAIQNWEEGMWK
jgi:hypothetical protein